jgi:hypothetical protein
VVDCSSPPPAVSQGIQQTPYSAADAVRSGMPPVVPGATSTNPPGLPGSSVSGLGSSNNVSISSGLLRGILPSIPNLELGYTYTFGSNIRAGTASIDYLLPFNFGNSSTIYGEAHAEFQRFSYPQSGTGNQQSLDLCLGGGYRRKFGNETLIGIHSFFDTASLSGNWYSCGSIGVEFAALIAGHDAIDVNFNWYGKALDAAFLMNSLDYIPDVNQVGFGASNYDFQVGYSHELYGGGPDLRLSVTGYKFDTGSGVYGYYAGTELKSRNGVFVLKYDVGHDNSNLTYQAVGAFMNIGFRLENLVAGESPFEMPKPVFQSPRNLAGLTETKVKRDWKHTTHVAQAAVLSAQPASAQCPVQTVTIVNSTNSAVTLYMGFNSNATGGYDLSTAFPGWTIVPAPPPYTSYLLTTTMAATDPPLVVSFSNVNQLKTSFIISVNQLPQQGCAVTQAEFTLCDNWGQYGGLQDSYDVSLVNGFNYPMELTPTSGQNIQATAATGNANNPGVFGFGWTGCNAAPPPLTCTPTPGENHTPAPPATPVPPCQISQTNGANFTLTIGP